MSRKKRNSRNDIVIDLTSLLDVIFIILLVFIVGEENEATIDQQELAVLEDAAQQQVSEYQNAEQLYQNMLNTNDNIRNYVWLVSITVPFNNDEIHKRTIKILPEGGEVQEFDLIGNDVEAPLQAFKDSLGKSISEHSECPIILALNEDNEKILYRDEKTVSRILFELSEEYDNVYVKGNLSEVEP